MANYNPYSPYILGNEWVPIRNNSYSYSQDANSFELGTRFTTTQSYTLNWANFYVDEMAPQFYRDQIMNASIYPLGTETHSGPIRRVLIPCNAADIANGVTLVPPVANNTNVAANVADPGADLGLVFAYYIKPSESGVATTRTANFHFATNQYAIPLQGKRIIGLNFLYNLTVSQLDGYIDNGVSFLQLSIRAGTSPVHPLVYYPDLLFGPQFVGDAGISRLRFGDTCQFFSNSDFALDVMPWRYDQLQRFESTNANPLAVRLQLDTQGDFGPTAIMSYAALEVLYCEETRIITGSHIFNHGNYSLTGSPTGGIEVSYVPGENRITLWDIPTANTQPTLPAGDYLLTLSQGNWGDVASTNLATRPEPTVNAAYQLYELPTIKAKKILIPVPTDRTIEGKTLTEVPSQILPQLSLRSNAGVNVIPETHVYGKQSRGQVWGANTVTQNILDNTGNVRSYSAIRFWGRRFGDTSVSLTVASGSFSASITPASFDLLDEIVDGWKQIDLRSGVALALGAGGNPTLTWSAAGEAAGNRWEVLGCQGPALSGVTGNLQNHAFNQLGTGTYGEPSAGTTILEGWMPQFSPQVSATAADSTADVSVLLAVDPIAPVSFAVVTASQSLTGVNSQCGVAPYFVPTSMSYNRITWSTVNSISLPASGFGYYELQRSDTLTDWQTIMTATSPAVSGFNDFEARVGVLTSYRIRAVNHYLFVSTWSLTVTNTLTSPGISGSGMDSDNYVMLFTSNQAQNGARNLAYSMAWESGSTTENFTFPEAGWVKLQPMFNRDFYTAFHPTERGGAQFNRTVLVQACATSLPPTLPNFTSIRDLAWDSLPYVCLRDEDGNRWLTNIIVPGGRVVNRRQQYLVDLSVTEVTATAAVITVAS